MKRFAMFVTVLASVAAAKSPYYSIVAIDDLTVVIPPTCHKRPPITADGGDYSYVEKFYNLKGINQVGASWYWDGCNWVKTNKKCQYEKDANDELEVWTIKPSSLKDHHTMIYSSVDGKEIIGCSLESNYNLGQGFNQYNDFKIFHVHDGYIEGAGFSDWEPDGNWWIRTPGEIIVKENYPEDW